MADVRAIVEDAVRRLQQLGDTSLHLISGPDVIGPGDAEMLSDGIHPTAAGYALLAERIAPILAAL